MRVNYDYKSKEDWEQEKAEFMSLYYYFDDEEWFDKEAIDKYVHNKQNPFYNANLKIKILSDINFSESNTALLSILNIIKKEDQLITLPTSKDQLWFIVWYAPMQSITLRTKDGSDLMLDNSIHL